MVAGEGLRRLVTVRWLLRTAKRARDWENRSGLVQEHLHCKATPRAGITSQVCSYLDMLINMKIHWQ